MTNADIFKHLRRSDLPPDLQIIWDYAGGEVVRTLLETVSGVRVYIPSLTALPTLMNRVIHELALTQSVMQISQTLKVSPAFVRKQLADRSGIQP